MNIPRIDDGEKTTLELSGTLDVTTAATCDPVFDAVVAEGRKYVTLEMSRLESIDNSGVAKVISLYKRVRAQGGEVHIAGIRDQPRAIFQLLRFDRVFPEMT